MIPLAAFEVASAISGANSKFRSNNGSKHKTREET